jgi:predicted phosphodiesterase
MRIGILSETHGHIERTRAAIELLSFENPAKIIHCGDIGSPAVLGELVAVFQPKNVCIHAVLGNVDYPDEIYDEWLQPGVLEIPGRFADLTTHSTVY